MALVASLLTAIVRVDGDALVLHAGERPYVVAPTGQSELSSRVLTLDAMNGMLNELLPVEARQVLEQDGAVQHLLDPIPASHGEGFTVVAARGGDDVWIEIRRRRKSAEPEVPLQEAPVEMPEVVVEQVVYAEPVMAVEHAAPIVEPVADEPYVPQPYVPEPYVPEPYTPEPYTPEPYVPEQYVPPPYVPEPEAYTPAEPESIRSEQEQPPLAEYNTMPTDTREMSPSLAQDLRSESSLADGMMSKKLEQTVTFTPPPHSAGIDRLLRIAAARGASTLYLTSQSRPSIRVDGEILAIEGESALSEPEVEALMLDIIPDRNRESLHSDAGTEWICDVPDVGRVRCVTFRDHRGAGGILRMIPARAISAEQLGLSREIQGLCTESDGLLLITGPRSSGKSTLISAFVDLINRNRSDHVITLETQIKFVHENRLSLVSQREVRGDNGELLRAARAALRENPDVLVIEELRSPEVAALAIEAAQSGHLVIGALTAHSTSEALERIVDQTPADRRAKIQTTLAESLRGVVGQVLLRKTGGGRVAAREVLLNTASLATMIAEGKMSQLPMAIESGRRHGMVPLNDALSSFVQSGVVDSREAYRRSADQQAFLALLKRQGIDTSFVERLGS